MVSKKKLVIVVNIIFLFIIIGVVYYLSGITSAINKLNFTQGGPVGVNGSLAYTGVFTFNNASSLVAYAKFNYVLTNTSGANVSMFVYRRNPIMPVYLVDLGPLNESCNKCANQPRLLAGLYRYLSKYSLIHNSSSLKTVSLANLSKTPRNSVIIIPSGIFPGDILPYSINNNYTAGNFTIINLFARGDVIIYIGQDFTNYLDKGIIYKTNTSSSRLLPGILANYSLVTENVRRLYNNTPLYFNIPSYRFQIGSNIGAVSLVNSGNGTFVAFSVPPNWWHNESREASDIAYVINTRAWMQAYAYGYTNVNISYGTNKTYGHATIFTLAHPFNTSYQNPYFSSTPTINSTIINNSYALISINASGFGGSATKLIPFKLSLSQNGTLSMPGVVQNTQGAILQVILNKTACTATSGTGCTRLYRVEVYNPDFTNLATIIIGPVQINKSVFITHTTYLCTPGALCLSSGYYIASLKDDLQRTHSSALFYLAPFLIRPLALDFRNGTFAFRVISNGTGVSGLQYSANLGGLYEANGTIINGTLLYVVPRGVVLGPGQYTINLKILNTNYTFARGYIVIGGIPTFYIEFGIVIIFIIFFNLVARAPERDEYYINVPNFPPVSKTQIDISPAQIIGLFDKVNKNYSWSYMPLIPEEIRAGINNNIRQGNILISVTLQNTIDVLYTLVGKGNLDYVENYYMPKEWEKTANHDIEYLVIYRKLRDYAVEHSISISNPLASQNEDAVISKGGVQSRVFIYSSKTGIKSIRITKGSKIFIVFLNEEIMDDFVDNLHEAYGEGGEILKMGIGASLIILVSTENLSQLLLL